MAGYPLGLNCSRCGSGQRARNVWRGDQLVTLCAACRASPGMPPAQRPFDDPGALLGQTPWRRPA